MNAIFSPLPAGAAILQQGGGSTWVWIVLILVIVVVLLWWLGRQEERGAKQDDGSVVAPPARSEMVEPPLVATRGELPPLESVPLVETPPHAVMPVETVDVYEPAPDMAVDLPEAQAAVEAETVEAYEPASDVVMDQQEAQATVEAGEDAPTTGAFEFAPPGAPPAEPVPGPVEGFPDLGFHKAGPAQLEDLEIIEGIGPKIASVLRGAGVDTFAQLAEMKPAEITEILHAAGLRLADPTTWPEQARLAMEGKWDEFKALTDSLRGGRQAR